MNENSKHISDDLLVRYMLGEANEAERAEVSGWIAAEKENKRYYEHFMLIWEQSRKLAANSAVDEEAAWLRFQQKVNYAGSGQPVVRRVFPIKPLRLAAALLLFIIGGGIAYYLASRNNARMLVVKSGDHVLIDTLSDGSVVTLNKMSVLTYPADFKGNERDVQLQGEAFFSISHDKYKPFIIKANGAEVKVVGTSFNVRTSEDKTEVIVETGVVEVSKKKNMVKLDPHEKATVFKNEEVPVKERNDDELYSYYKTNEFICDHTPLRRLAEVLNDAYNVHIIVVGNTGDRQISVTFSNKSLDEILNIVAETMAVRVEKNGNEIIIK